MNAMNVKQPGYGSWGLLVAASLLLPGCAGNGIHFVPEKMAIEADDKPISHLIVTGSSGDQYMVDGRGGDGSRMFYLRQPNPEYVIVSDGADTVGMIPLVPGSIYTIVHAGGDGGEAEVRIQVDQAGGLQELPSTRE